MDKNTHLGDQITAFLKQNLLKTNMNILQVLLDHKTPPMQSLNCLHSCKWLEKTNPSDTSVVTLIPQQAEQKATDSHGRDINAEVI